MPWENIWQWTEACSQTIAFRELLLEGVLHLE